MKVSVKNNESKVGDSNISVGGQSFGHSNTPLTYDGIGITLRDYGIHEKYGIVNIVDALGMKGIWKI